jgi:two-component system NtrC family sensor kinase
VYSALGDIYRDEGKLDLAKDAYQNGLQLMEANNNYTRIANISLYLSNLYRITHQADSSLLYANKALATFQKHNDRSGIKSAYCTLSYAYDLQHKTDRAFAYLKRGVILHDSLDTVEIRNLLGFQNIGFDEQLRLKKLEEEQIQTRAKIRTCAMLAGIVVFMVITSLLYRNSLNRKKANALLQKQKQEIAGQKENLKQTLVELKSAQAQLIQSEKMDSLGELTAGIAHEIQNPLNFMNNFSEVNSELIGEMKQELDNGNLQDAKTIADSIDENEQKINFHGKRAESIVKGMLQHTRSSTGLKEPTDLNALAGEYLRLAYHGLRAKDNSFNATIKTDFDAGIGNLNIVPQEIGRVLLNLYNNAFYALSEKKKSTDAGYDPTLSVSTKKTGDKITITVEDNGNGIPRKVVDKIFQPFFTTKPAGQGTGLGLSLSYDIVKAHGGEITVKTKEGDGTSFIINFNA